MKKTFKHSKFTAVFTDENGYFSLTGEVDGCSGAVGDEIAKIAPEFEPLAKMHLCNSKTGAPVHSWINAEYLYKKGEIDRVQVYLRMDNEKIKEFEIICNQLFIAQKLVKDIIGYDSKVELLQKRFSSFKSKIEEQWVEEAREVYKIVDSIPSDLTSNFVNPYDEEDDPISEEYEDCLAAFDDPEKAIAAAMEEDCDVCDVKENGEYYHVAGREYRVLTDIEADDACDEAMDNYIDESVLPEFPESLRNYFDEEKWKEDARNDGRGHSLASYDGEEREQEVNGTMYYLYKC